MSHAQTVLAIAAGAAAIAFGVRAFEVVRSGRARDRLADMRVLRQFVSIPPVGGAWLRACLVALGVGSLTAAAVGTGDPEPAREEREDDTETVLVLDASNSMLARDLEPSRLEVQRDLARVLASRLPGRLAVVYFAGRGYVLSPLTTDLNAVRMFVDAVRPANVGLGGSSLAAGLTQALDLLAGGADDARKSVVLLSDGEETVERPTAEALERARDAGVVVHAIGVGTVEGGAIPLGRDAAVDPATTFERRRGESFLRGPDGEVVISSLESGTLRTIAAETGGLYLPAEPRSVARLIESVSDEGPADPATEDTTVGWLLLFGFGLLWGEAFLFRRG